MKKKDDGVNAFKEKLKSDNLSGIYIFTGEEKFARRAAVDSVRKKFEEYGFSEFNIQVFEEKAATVSAVSDYIEAFPVMSEFKLAIIKNSGIFKSASDEVKNFWIKTSENFPEYLAVIFDEDNIDGRNALAKKMKSVGIYTEFNYKTPAELAAWCGKIFAKANISITPEVLEHLIFSCDEGMENVKNESEKLIAYCEDKRQVSMEDVDLIVRKSLQSRIFEMLDAISYKNASLAYTRLNELKIYKESPIKIIAMLGRQSVMLLKTSVLLEENRYGEIASELKIPPFIAKKYIEQARNTSTPRLSDMVNKCTDADYKIKSGITDDWTAVEVLISELIDNNHKS